MAEYSKSKGVNFYQPEQNILQERPKIEKIKGKPDLLKIIYGRNILILRLFSHKLRNL